MQNIDGKKRLHGSNRIGSKGNHEMKKARLDDCSTTTSMEIEENEGVRAIVIDYGTSTIRAGFSGDDDPKTILPSILDETTPNAGKFELRTFLNSQNLQLSTKILHPFKLQIKNIVQTPLQSMCVVR